MTTAIKTAAELEDWLGSNDKIADSLKDGTFADTVKAYIESAAPQITGDIQDQIQRGIHAYIKEQREKGQTPVNLVGDLNAGPRTSAMRNAAYNPEAPGAKLDGCYPSIGRMALDVLNVQRGRKPVNPEAFEKVRTISDAYSENDPASGGFLVPEEVRSTLLQTALENSFVRQNATVITMGSASVKIPFVDAKTTQGSVFGGMVFYWVGESQTITPSEAKFGNIKLEANKLVGGARIPNELWADAPALISWLDAAAPMGIGYYEDVAYINGNGVDQPLGVLKSTAKVTVTRATTGTLVPADVYKMYSRMLPQSLGNAVWLVNQTLLPLLFGMQTIVKNVAGTENVGGGFPLGVINIGGTAVPTLLGRPMIVTEKIPALGNGAGQDLAFVDWNYYLIGDRQAVSLDYSEHSRFMNDETEMRLIQRVDGKPWMQDPIQPLNGDTLSPYVVLSN